MKQRFTKHTIFPSIAGEVMKQFFITGQTYLPNHVVCKRLGLSLQAMQKYLREDYLTFAFVEFGLEYLPSPHNAGEKVWSLGNMNKIKNLINEGEI